MRFLNKFFAAVVAVAAIAACTKDKPSGSKEFAEMNFSGKTLAMNYGNEVMYGKNVCLRPVAGDASKGELVITGGTFSFMEFGTYNIASLFGTDKVVIAVDVNYMDSALTFKGNAVVNDFTVECEGTVASGKMNLAVNATIKDNKLVGKYILNTDATTNIEWNGENGAPIKLTLKPIINEPWELKNLLVMALGAMKLVPDPTFVPGEAGAEAEKLTAIEALKKVMEGMEFHANGNITVNARKTESFVTPQNVALFANVSEDSFKTFIDPNAIVAYRENAAKATKAVDLMAVLKTAADKACGNFEKGFDVAYSFDENTGVLAVNIDERTILPVLQAFLPVLEDKEMMKSIESMIINSIPEGNQMKPLLTAILPDVLSQLPTIVKDSREIVFGVNLKPATEVAE